MRDRTEIEECLDALNGGDGSAWDRLIPLVYDQLRNEAHAVFRNERSTLQATALLHDALADLLSEDLEKLKFEGPGRFFALASRVIRNRLSDHVRRRKAGKRGGGAARVRLDERGGELAAEFGTIDLIALHEVLEQLRDYDERLWSVTELKFLLGLTNQEAADALGIAVKTVEADWTFAKSWLRKQLGGER